LGSGCAGGIDLLSVLQVIAQGKLIFLALIFYGFSLHRTSVEVLNFCLDGAFDFFYSCQTLTLYQHVHSTRNGCIGARGLRVLINTVSAIPNKPLGPSNASFVPVFIPCPRSMISNVQTPNL
jgi:hypothetical protein